jgi:hypothetical protein
MAKERKYITENPSLHRVQQVMGYGGIKKGPGWDWEEVLSESVL